MGKSLKPASDSTEIEAFINQAKDLAVRDTGRGRLLFAMDATASRRPTWDHACQLQSEMFLASAESGQLLVQLCYYRGYREFHYTGWVDSAAALLDQMDAVSCLGGHTQIGRVLEHALRENSLHPLNAIVLVGDCCEEKIDPLCEMAGELGLHGTPIFSFHEGNDPNGRLLFEQLARLSGGAFARFDLKSASRLRELLGAAAVYATGGLAALERYAGKGNRQLLALTQQLRK
ncbi:VWA domain-containing protein [Marinobacterium sp. D7]|uniref:VWA domain-containing protein n=1 Tax=Marinobacterium ramblicola TaxID=2849041 RepID=UPI001C2D0A75|nr:VWA domain-containing protein [Marinobacterium ramblicola]MBV1788590.1 VWA domain-containing protein [Marinobacterium ramblicola]